MRGIVPPARRRWALPIACGGLAVLVLVGLGVGDYPLTPADVVRAFFDVSDFSHTVVVSWRLPRVLTALVFGAALALSGAVFQTITDNPLGSPDVVGFSTGAYSGALVAMTLLNLGPSSAAGGALVGGVATALLVYAFAFRRGAEGYRLIITGIGVTAGLSSLNVWMLLRSDSEQAMAAMMWGAGSLADVAAVDLAVSACLLAAVVALVCTLVRPLRQLELGDATARAHGVSVEPVRLALVVLAVALIAVVTAYAGPIAFVALLSPQIAARIGRTEGLPLVLSAVVGAIMLLAADLVAQHVLPGGVPVGTVTVVLGGAYLLWLIVAQTRRKGRVSP